MPTTLRFSNQGPIVLGLGGSYPSYASIPTVFGGPTQGITISVYNRGGSYVPNNLFNTSIPLTIGAGNPVDFSDYYTSTNYTTGALPPIPDPRPTNPNDPNPGLTLTILVELLDLPSPAYIGQTIRVGYVTTRGVFQGSQLYTSNGVIIDGNFYPNVGVGEPAPQNDQSPIEFVVDGKMPFASFETMRVSVVGLDDPYIFGNYFSRSPLNYSIAGTLSSTQAMTGQQVVISNLLSLQVTPPPIVRIGGVFQTIQSIIPGMITVGGDQLPVNTIVITLSQDTPVEYSDIVIYNNKGDNVTLPEQLRRVDNENPVDPENPTIPVDRGGPATINWEAEEPTNEIINIAFSNDLTLRPANVYPTVTPYVANTNRNSTVNAEADAELLTGTTTGGYYQTFVNPTGVLKLGEASGASTFYLQTSGDYARSYAQGTVYYTNDYGGDYSNHDSSSLPLSSIANVNQNWEYFGQVLEDNGSYTNVYYRITIFNPSWVANTAEPLIGLAVLSFARYDTFGILRTYYFPQSYGIQISSASAFAIASGSQINANWGLQIPAGVRYSNSVSGFSWTPTPGQYYFGFVNGAPLVPTIANYSAGSFYQSWRNFLPQETINVGGNNDLVAGLCFITSCYYGCSSGWGTAWVMRTRNSSYAEQNWTLSTNTVQGVTNFGGPADFQGDFPGQMIRNPTTGRFYVLKTDLGNDNAVLTFNNSIYAIQSLSSNYNVIQNFTNINNTQFSAPTPESKAGNRAYVGYRLFKNTNSYKYWTAISGSTSYTWLPNNYYPTIFNFPSGFSVSSITATDSAIIFSGRLSSGAYQVYTINMLSSNSSPQLNYSISATNRNFLYFKEITPGDPNTGFYASDSNTTLETGSNLEYPASTSYEAFRPNTINLPYTGYFNYGINFGFLSTNAARANAAGELITNGLRSVGAPNPTYTVSTDSQNNTILRIDTSTTQASDFNWRLSPNISPNPPPLTGTITVYVEGGSGSTNNNVTRLAVPGVQAMTAGIYIDEQNGYTFNISSGSWTTFTHDADSFTSDSMVISNPYVPSNITDLTTYPTEQ